MTWQIHILIIIIATVIIVGAYESKRDTDIMYYHKPHSRNFFLTQPFIDKVIGQQTLPAIPARNQIINQKTLNDVFLKDQTISSSFPTFRHQPFKQNSFTAASFKDEPLFRDTVLKNQKLHGERAIFGNYPFERQSLMSEEIFNRQASAFRSQTPFKEQLFATKTPFKNLFYRQSSSGEQALLQKQAAIAEFPSISNPIKFYRDDYNKPIDSYKRNKNIRSSFYEESPTYIEYDNEELGLPLIPMVPSSKQLPPDTELMMPVMPSTPVINHESESPISSISSGIDESYSSEVSKMKLDMTPSSELATSMSTSNCNAPVDSSPTTVPSISVSTNQSSVVGHILTSLTTEPSSPIMSAATSIAPFVGNILEPIYFHATKHGAVVKSSLPIQNELKNSMHAYLFSHMPKSNFKTNEHDFKFLVPKVPKNDMKTNTQRPMLSILPEKYKSEMKDIQDFTNYVLPERLKHDWPSQQFSQPETLSSYIPLSLNGKAKLTLPSIPIAPISSISWPIETKSEVSTMLPLKSLTVPDTTTNNLPLGIDLPLDFMTNILNSLTPSITDSLSESITGGLSTAISDGMTADVPVRIPTLNLGQSLHRAEQLRQAQEARNPWYPTGLQLQLGGFGGINYTLHTGNPATRPMKLGIAKAGLTLPKLSQPHAPAFAKIGVGYHL